MAAVAPPASIVNGSHESGKDTQADHSPSRFTAVNGKESSGSVVPALAPVLGSVNGKDAHHEGGADLTWTASGYNTSPQQSEGLHDGVTTSQEQDDRNSQRSSSHAASLGTNNNKRKRSESIEQQASPPELQAGRGMQRSPAYHHDESSELHAQSTITNGAIQEHLVQSPSTRYPRVGSPDDQRGSTSTAGWHDYDSQLISQAQKAQNLDASDAQLAEALQREAQGTDSGDSKAWGPASRSVETPEESDQHSFPSYAQDRSQAAVQVGPKRKRVFSNRTKTGCMTCRRRKKKCDEQHPQCKSTTLLAFHRTLAKIKTMANLM